MAASLVGAFGACPRGFAWTLLAACLVLAAIPSVLLQEFDFGGALDNPFDEALPNHRSLRSFLSAGVGGAYSSTGSSRGPKRIFETKSAAAARRVASVGYAATPSSGTCVGTGYQQRYIPQYIKNQMNGPVISKPLGIYMIWVGNISDVRKALLRNFVRSLNPQPVPQFTVDDWWNVSTQYWGGSFTGAAPTGGWVSSKVRIAAEYNVTVCDLVSYDIISNTPSEADVETIVIKSIVKAGWPVSQSALYYVFTDGTIFPGQSCSGYCGYHNTLEYPVTSMANLSIAYAWSGIPEGCLHNCVSDLLNTTEPIDIAMQGAINTFAHELAEAATDPQLNAWYTNQGEEIGDICNWEFGNVTSWWNLEGLGGQKYLIQLIYDPVIGECILGIPTVRAAPPKAPPPPPKV